MILKDPTIQTKAMEAATKLKLKLPSGYQVYCNCQKCKPITIQLSIHVPEILDLLTKNLKNNPTPITEDNEPEPKLKEDNKDSTNQKAAAEEIQHLEMLITATINGNPFAKSLLSNYAKNIYELRNQLLTINPEQIAIHDELWHTGYEIGLKDGTDKTVVTEQLKKEVHEEIKNTMKLIIQGAITNAFVGTRLTHVKREFIKCRIMKYLYPDDPKFETTNIPTG